jgi:hypothetical protein
MDSAGKIIDAVPLADNKIKTSPTDATNDPIDIYVERTAAKVAVISNSSVGGDATIFKVSSSISTISALCHSSKYFLIHAKLFGFSE